MSRNAHFSPDGTKIAYQSDRDIFVMDVDGGNRVRITDDADAYFFYGTADFSWSPDGTRIAFAKAMQGRSGIFTVRPDGTGLDRLPTNPRLPNAEHPVWSPDGTQIAFSADSQGSSARRAPGGVFVMDVDGSHPVRVAPHGGHTPIWSPDGSKIAVDENGLIYIVTPDGTLGNYLVGCGRLGIDWSSDSEHLIVFGNADPFSGGPSRCRKGGAIFLADANGQARTKVVQPSREAVSVWPLWQPSEVTDVSSPS